MKSLLLILTALALSWHFSELGAEDAVQGIVAPLGVVISLIALALWLVLKAGFGTKTNSRDVGGADIGGGD